MAGKGHTHKYYRAQLSFGEVWACALPDCNHHMPEHYASLMNGKRSICWQCGDTMILDPDALTMKRPTCLNCRTGVSIGDVDELLTNLKKKVS